ncbi:MAG: hypothetical protein ABIC57_02025 [bacterium]
MSIYKAKTGKILFWIFMVFVSLYFGFFSVIQLRNAEGTDKIVYENLDNQIGNNDILFVARSNYSSFNQTVFPMRYYYGINVFPLEYLSYIHKKEIIEEKIKYENSFVLTTTPGLNRQYRGEFTFIGEIDFTHNYFVHCNRDEDAYFEMVGSTEDIPLCEYVIIPNRYYFGQFKAYLYRWE